MLVKIILNGGLKTCCSSYSGEFVRESVENWVGDMAQVEVIDREKTLWEPDEVAGLALKYFNDRIFPLVYIEDTLAMLGRLPDRDTLLKMLRGEVAFGATANDIINAARRHGILNDKGE